ncbi:MAG: 2-oxoglutarate-dependent dioxygenase, partial [Variovorax sp.]
MAAQLAAGHSVPALRASMRAAGWHDDVADAALAELESNAAADAVVTPQRAMPGPDLESAPLEIMAADRRVRVLQTMRHPRVIVFGNLLDDEE